MRILIVDDIPASRLILESALKKLGHQVIQAGNGEEAWLALRREPVDAVITDWLMPELDGPDLCRRIRGDAATRGICVILLTALSGSQRYVVGLQAGADDCLRKPFDVEELAVHLSLAQRILDLQRQIQALRD